MKRDLTIDIARTLAMLYIFSLWHLTDYTKVFTLRPFGEFITYAALGLFTFISGYLLSFKYKINSIDTLKVFISKRIIRIIPLYCVALMIYVLAGTISLKEAGIALVGLSTFFPPQPPTLWYVSMIITFYFIFILFSNKSTTYQFVIFLVVYFLLYILDLFYNNIDYRFFYYFPCFFCGIISSKIFIEKIISSHVAALVFILVFLLLPPLCSYFSISLLRYFIISIIALSGTFILLYLSHYLSKMNIAFIVEPLAYGSMTTYMFHRQIISFIRNYIYWPEDGVSRLCFFLFLCIPFILFFGFIIQFLYDLILKKYLKKITC